MGVSIPVGFGQFTMPFRLIGDLEEMVCTLGFTDDLGASPDAIAATIYNIWLAQPTFAASTVSNQYSFGPGEVTVNRALGTFQGVGGVARTGTSTTTPPLPHNTAILITKHTNRGGRHGRGRLYLPPFMVSEGNVTAVGGILQSVVDSTSLDFSNILAQMIAVNLAPVLLHQAPPVGPTIPPDPLTDMNCSPLVATQRRRLRR